MTIEDTCIECGKAKRPEEVGPHPIYEGAKLCRECEERLAEGDDALLCG